MQVGDEERSFRSDSIAIWEGANDWNKQFQIAALWFIFYTFDWSRAYIKTHTHTWLFASARFDSGSFNCVFTVGFSLCYFARFWLGKQLSFLLWNTLSCPTCLLITTTHFYAYGYSGNWRYCEPIGYEYTIVFGRIGIWRQEKNCLVCMGKKRKFNF